MIVTYQIDVVNKLVVFLFDDEVKVYPGLPFDFFTHARHSLELRREQANNHPQGSNSQDGQYCVAWLVARDELVERGLIPE